MTIYKHLYHRVNYPEERGYRIEPVDAPRWMKIEVTEEQGSKVLYVHSRIHMNKKVRVGPLYSTEFTNHQILKDLSGEIYHRFIH